MIKANDILKLLLQRHKNDIAVPECKNGSTWSSNNILRFDLWVMKKSYTRPMTWIYEIKVSRSDFINDNKWQKYLPYCTDFYFVAPIGVIDVTEVPEQAGLLLSSKNGTRLYCKKKAPHRHVDISDNVLKYILMSRSKIINGLSNESYSPKKYWEMWFINQNENQDLGHNVSRKIRQLYNKNVKSVKTKQDQLEYRIEKLENVKKTLKEIGFNPNCLGYNYKQKIIDRVTEINEGFPEKNVIKHLKNAVLDLQKTINIISQ